VLLAMVMGSTPRSLAAKPQPSSAPIGRPIPAICKQVLAPYKPGVNPGPGNEVSN
jgi:hypothetical protein